MADITPVEDNSDIGDSQTIGTVEEPSQPLVSDEHSVSGTVQEYPLSNDPNNPGYSVPMTSPATVNFTLLQDPYKEVSWSTVDSAGQQYTITAPRVLLEVNADQMAIIAAQIESVSNAKVERFEVDGSEYKFSGKTAAQQLKWDTRDARGNFLFKDVQDSRVAQNIIIPSINTSICAGNVGKPATQIVLTNPAVQALANSLGSIIVGPSGPVGREVQQNLSHDSGEEGYTNETITASDDGQNAPTTNRDVEVGQTSGFKLVRAFVDTKPLAQGKH